MKYKLSYLVEPYFYTNIPAEHKANYYRSFKIKMLDEITRRLVDRGTFKVVNKVAAGTHVLPDGVLTADQAIAYDMEEKEYEADEVEDCSAVTAYTQALVHGTMMEAEIYILDKDQMRAVLDYIRGTENAFPGAAKDLKIELSKNNK